MRGSLADGLLYRGREGHLIRRVQQRRFTPVQSFSKCFGANRVGLVFERNGEPSNLSDHFGARL